LMVPFGAVHAALMVLAVVLIYYFPLTRRRHALIVKRLAQREERLRAAAVA
jgi:Na+/melibiose symporter-like transporter